jgi:hypothetical protein
VGDRSVSSDPGSDSSPQPPTELGEFVSVVKEFKAAWNPIRLLTGMYFAVVAGPLFLAIGIYTGDTYFIVLSSALLVLLGLLAFLVWKRSWEQERPAGRVAERGLEKIQSGGLPAEPKKKK